MRTPVRNDAFAKYTNQVYDRRDLYDICPICGEDIYWPEEDVILDEHGQIFHAACVEKKGGSV